MVAAKNRMFRTGTGRIITVQDAAKAGLINADDIPKDEDEAIAFRDKLVEQMSGKDREKLLDAASNRVGYKINRKIKESKKELLEDKTRSSLQGNIEPIKEKQIKTSKMSNSIVNSYATRFSTNKKNNLSVASEFVSELGLKAHTTNPSGRKIDSRFAAIYNNVTGEIFLNPRSSYWKDPIKVAKVNFEKGQLSTDHPLGVIFHEVGHAKYKAPDNFTDNFRQRSIAERVSKYARMNPKEFVSETYAGLQTGKTYDNDVMSMFKLYARDRA